MTVWVTVLNWVNAVAFVDELEFEMENEGINEELVGTTEMEGDSIARVGAFESGMVTVVQQHF